MYYDCGFHGYLHCFVLIICTLIVAFMGIFIIYCQLHVLIICIMIVASMGIFIVLF